MQISSWTVRCSALCLAAVIAQSASAVTLNAVEDTYITIHPGLGGPDSNHGGDATLWQIGQGDFNSNLLFKFDLSGFAGQTVVGSPTLEVFNRSAFGGNEGVSQAISVHPVLVDWDEGAVTWNNFGDSPGFADDFDAAEDTTVVTFNAPGNYFDWSLSSALLQSWIDDPANNHGVLFISPAGGAIQQDLIFDARETTPGNPPRLNFDLLQTEEPEPSVPGGVPEPLTATLGGLAGMALLVCGRRRR